MLRVTITTILLLLIVEASAQDALLRVQERAKYLNDFKALLENEDSIVRQAAIEEALKTDDAQLRSMALETALASDDQLLQTSAIRWYLNERTQIPVTLTLPERPNDGQKYIFQNWNPLILTKIEVTGQDEIQFNARGGQGGQLIRGGMDLRFSVHSGVGCAMTIRPAGGTALVGQFSCNFGAYSEKYGAEQTAIVARIDLS